MPNVVLSRRAHFNMTEDQMASYLLKAHVKPRKYAPYACLYNDSHYRYKQIKKVRHAKKLISKANVRKALASDLFWKHVGRVRRVYPYCGNRDGLYHLVGEWINYLFYFMLLVCCIIEGLKIVEVIKNYL